MTAPNSKITILVVDDEPDMCMLIAEYLSENDGYTVLTACDGVEALEKVLPNHHVDLILSDINMPRMKGFELLHNVRERWPDIKRVLITAYNVEDYLELAVKYDIGNIFVKTTPFNFDELSSLLANLLSNDIFGADRYMNEPFEKRVLSVRRGDRLDELAREIIAWIPGVANIRKLELVLVELINNAVFYGIRGESPERKETWNHDFTLDADQAVSVEVLWDDAKYAVAITDKGGRLTKQGMLYWLNRQISKDETGLPLGLMDSHGRGLFITRKYIDRVLVNIDPGTRTEIVVINYYNEMFCGYKPLYINEI